MSSCLNYDNWCSTCYCHFNLKPNFNNTIQQWTTSEDIGVGTGEQKEINLESYNEVIRGIDKKKLRALY